MRDEFELIATIRRRTARRSASVVLGVGDDAALVRPAPGFDVAASSDLLVEGVHFRRDWSTPELLGRKALAVSLSDMAAMGALPRAALVGLAVPRELDPAWIDAFYDGALAVADRYGVTIAGGDTSSSPGPIFVDAILLGEVEAGRALRRGGAAPGDDLWVSGALGTSHRGLRLLAAGVRLDSADGPEREAILAHLDPTPRVELGRALLERSLATSALDVSDGLSSDIGHLARESRMGIVVEAPRLPCAGSLDDALHGGEQYELLFTAPPLRAGEIERLSADMGLALTLVGRVEGEPGNVALEDENGGRVALAPRGWNHFAPEAPERP